MSFQLLILNVGLGMENSFLLLSLLFLSFKFQRANGQNVSRLCLRKKFRKIAFIRVDSECTVSSLEVSCAYHFLFELFSTFNNICGHVTDFLVSHNQQSNVSSTYR